MLDALAHAANAAECELETAVDARVPGLQAAAQRSRSCRSPGRRSRAAATRPSCTRPGAAPTRTSSTRNGIPCVNIANGMELIHTSDERIAVADVEMMVDVTLALVEGARTAS